MQHRLALALGSPLDNAAHETLVSGGCRSAAQFTVAGSAVIDAWKCEIAIVEKNEKRKFVASSVIQFGLTQDKWKLIPETLRLYVMSRKAGLVARPLGPTEL